jgi:hypothetical protein
MAQSQTQTVLASQHQDDRTGKKPEKLPDPGDGDRNNWLPRLRTSRMARSTNAIMTAVEARIVRVPMISSEIMRFCSMTG